MKKVQRLAACVIVFLLITACAAFAESGENKVPGIVSESMGGETENSARVVNTYVLYENNEPYVGDEVILVAELAGFSEGSYKIQWQYSPDGVQWYDAEGATEQQYAFLLTFDNINYSWRVTVEDLAKD